MADSRPMTEITQAFRPSTPEVLLSAVIGAMFFNYSQPSVLSRIWSLDHPFDRYGLLACFCLFFYGLAAVCWYLVFLCCSFLEFAVSIILRSALRVEANLNPETDDICHICLVPFYESGEVPVKLRCNHEMGMICITTALRMPGLLRDCPICRRDPFVRKTK